MNSNSKNIVWIVSYPKSGNTWFRIFLANYLTKCHSPLSINEISIGTNFSNRDLFEKYSGTASSDLTIDEINNIRPKLFKRISEDSEIDIYIKVHDCWHVNSMNMPIFPEEITKGVIYLIRNPLEVLVSYSYHNNLSYLQTLEIMNDPDYRISTKKIKLYPQIEYYVSSWSQHATSWVDNSELPILVLRFEDIHQDPTKEFMRALSFLGIEIDDLFVNLAIRNTSFNILQQQENNHGFKEKPITAKRFFRRGMVDSWKDELKPDIIQSLISDNKDVMQRFDYI